MVELQKTKAGIKQISEIIALAKKIWIPTFQVYFSDIELNSLFSGMYAHDKLIIVLQNPNYNFFFVENTAQNQIGYYATEAKIGYLKLDKIYVALDQQGLGYGRWMYNQIVYEAKEIGLRKIELNVNRRNTPAIDFYKWLGFRILRSEDIPGPNGFIYDDFVMGVGV